MDFTINKQSLKERKEMVVFYWYPKCSTCRKAKKFLDEHGITYKEVNMIEHVPTKYQMTTWMDESHYPVRRYFNTSGQLYRASDLKDRLDTMSREEVVEALISDGMMIRRPILAVEDAVVFGFKEDQYKGLLNLE